MATIKETLRQFPGALKQESESTGNKILKLLQSGGQASFRGFGAVAIGLQESGRGAIKTVLPKSVEELIGVEELGFGREIKPRGIFQKELFGTDQPISPRSFGAELPGVSEKGKVAPFLGFALGAADLIPGGKQTKSVVVTTLKNVDNVDDVVKNLMKLSGMSKKVAEGIAPVLAKTDDVAEITKIVDDALKQSQDVVQTIKRVFQRTRNKPRTSNIPKELEPIANEARKYKSIDKIKSVKQGIPKERGFLSSTKEVVPEAKVAGKYVPRGTEDLAIKAKNLIKDDINIAEEVATTGTDDVAVATASELIKHYGEIGRYDDAARIANTIAPQLTEQGRAIQAASILGRLTPEGQVRFAAGLIRKYNLAVSKSRGGILGLKKKIPELSGQQAQEITDEMKRITKMPDGDDKAIAFHNLQEKIARLIPSPFYRKVINLWKAGLLTGLKTSGLNTFSNLWHGTSEIAKDVPAALIDNTLSFFTGKRTLALTIRGTRRGVGEGFGKGIRYMKTGFDERNVAAKLDYRKVNFGTSKLARGLQKYEQTIFRLMGAEDQPFYYGAKARSLYSQAIAEAKNKGLKGRELKKFIDDAVSNPTDEMLIRATNDAEIAVFQNRTILGDAARTIQRAPGGEVVVPFGRTPAAVANQLINYSPVGIVKGIVANIGKGRFDQRAFSQAVGRGLTGTGVIYIGTKLYEKGMLSLNYPKTDRERRQWELEGRKENAFKTPDGKWRNVAVLGPPGFVLIVGGYFQRAMDETGSFTNAMAEASLGGFTSLKDQTFLVGMQNFFNALDNPQSYALNTFSRLLASGIPTIVSDIGRTIDPLERRTNAKEEGAFAPLIGRTPRVRQTLEPRVDVFGRPVERAGNALETMADPTRPTRIKSSPLIDELRRLFDAGMPATPTEFGDEKKFRDVMTNEQRTQMMERAGSILEEKLTLLIKHDGYKALSDDEKMDKIQDFTQKARDIARAEATEELVGNLQGEDLRRKLSELKESGLLTRNVFNVWSSLFPR